jgi:hypothetical protein
MMKANKFQVNRLSPELSPLIHRRMAIAKETYLHRVSQLDRQSNSCNTINIEF